jgi:menaquinone-specific isochorismate synthase
VTQGPPLLARTRRVDHDLDLLALAGGEGVLLERSRVGLAGRGVARRVGRQEVADALAAIDVDNPLALPGTGAVAFGALPFAHPEHDTHDEMVIPEVVWGRDAEGTRWVTTIGPPDAPRPEVASLCAAPTAAPSPLPQHINITPVRPAEWWCDRVAQATEAIRGAGPDGLAKVVLAREILVEADVPFDRAVVLARLRSAYPGCFLFHIDGFLGASPELLVGRAGDIVTAQPMAGTVRRGESHDDDARLAAGLLGSSTYRGEHQITIDMVFDTLLPWCSYLDYEPEPTVVTMANLQHLATLVEGRLSHPAPSILELMAALHPTPAVNGWPRADAQAWIAAHEGFARGRYGGTVGWVDGEGNGTFAVSIRCADVHKSTARVVAGNGIVANSDPQTELAETEVKLQAMLGALTQQ